MEIAVLHEDLEDFTRLLSKQDVVRYHHGRTPSWLEQGQDMLNEVQLLVAGSNYKVVAIWCLVRPFGSEGGIGQDHVIPLS
jgi:hypothetical protein